ncbi:MAG: replicative DNA helicase [Clostridiales bacterium]|nr:replicative DNA helicase [Clostridiales bacterium]
MNDEKNINTYLLPADIEAEKAVLGAMLKSGDARADVSSILREEDFYLTEHREIYKTILEMEHRSIGVDLMTVFSELKRRKTAEIVGGLTYLSRLIDETIVVSNAKFYAGTVLDKSKMRQLINEADRIKEAAYSDELPPEDILDNAEQSILEIAHKAQRSNYTDINEILVENIQEIQELEKNKGTIQGIETGFKKVDEILGGFQKTDLIILAARPGVGKTAWALNIAEHAASLGNKVIVFSLEMANTQLGQRLLSMTANVPLENIRNGNISAEDWESLSEAQDSFYGLDLVVDETSVITPIEMKNKCRRFKQERGGLDLVVIDYLQLMSMGGYRIEQREKEIAAITRSVKIMAKELGCAVILLSQLSRGPEQRGGDHMPKLSDLRDSGAIEQDADIVIFLRRADYYESETDPANIDATTGLTCQVNIAKHRNGPTGIATLAWIPRYTKFANLAVGYEE